MTGQALALAWRAGVVRRLVRLSWLQTSSAWRRFWRPVGSGGSPLRQDMDFACRPARLVSRIVERGSTAKPRAEWSQIVRWICSYESLVAGAAALFVFYEQDAYAGFVFFWCGFTVNDCATQRQQAGMIVGGVGFDY